MLYLKTKHGLFWMLPTLENDEEVYLGVEDYTLGKFKDMEAAIRQLINQTTGYLRWDSLSAIKNKVDLSNWQSGTPDGWEAA